MATTGLKPAEGQARGEGHGVLLGDADVEEAVGELLGELLEAGALAHGRGDGQRPCRPSSRP